MPCHVDDEPASSLPRPATVDVGNPHLVVLGAIPRRRSLGHGPRSKRTSPSGINVEFIAAVGPIRPSISRCGSAVPASPRRAAPAPARRRVAHRWGLVGRAGAVAMPGGAALRSTRPVVLTGPPCTSPTSRCPMPRLTDTNRTPRRDDAADVETSTRRRRTRARDPSRGASATSAARPAASSTAPSGSASCSSASACRPTTDDETERSLDELALLVDTAGADVVGRVRAARGARPGHLHRQGQGRGAARAVRRAVDADTVVFDDELSPGPAVQPREDPRPHRASTAPR